MTPARWLALAVALGPVSAVAQGYVRTRLPDKEICLFWPDRHVTLRANSAGSARTPGDGEFTALSAAVGTWRTLAASCSDFQLTEDGLTGSTFVGYVQGGQNENVVVYRESTCAQAVPAEDGCHEDGTCGNLHGCWDHGEGILALTTTTYNTRNGTLLDADIELNAAQWDFTTSDVPGEASTDVQNTLTHELGHFVGFDHVQDPSSTMAPTAPPGELTKRVVDAATREGFCTVYPRGRPTPPCNGPSELRVVAESTASSGCTSVGDDAQRWAWLAWVGGLCAGGHLRQRRRRGHRLF